MDRVSLLILALALSLDSLTVGLLYGARGIRLSWVALLIVSTATGVLLAVAMSGGLLLAAAIPAAAARRIGAVMLAGTGAWVTYQTWRNHGRPPVRLRPAPPIRRVWQLKLGSVGVVVEILREPAAADLDHSGHISSAEALLLGIALALDSVAAGLGAAMAGFSAVELPLAAALGAFAMMLLGGRAARLLPFKLEGRWSMVHGLFLLALGLYRFVT